MGIRLRHMFLLLTITVLWYILIQIRSVMDRNKGEVRSNLYDDLSNTIGRTKKFGAGLPLRGQKSIPKIIHQIWNDEIVPVEFVDNLKSLVRDNPAPDWEYYWWTKESGFKFIKDKFPNLLEIVKDVSDIMRSDIIRYLVIYEYGGVYFDIDTASVKPLNDFVTSHRCSVALEPGEHYFYWKSHLDFLLANSALLCIRRHPFYAHLLIHLHNIRKDCRNPLSCTGPFMLSWFWDRFNKSGEFSGEVPDAVTSEVFQDVYDDKLQRRNLESNCYNNTKLPPYKIKICSNWIARGKEKRNLSELAITYHTWFHTALHPLKKPVDENHIQKVIPHAKIYGK